MHQHLEPLCDARRRSLGAHAIKRGLKVQPWVKTSLAPGSQVVTDYLARSGLDKPLAQLGYNLVGYGCTTCIGNSGPLPDAVAQAVNDGDLVSPPCFRAIAISRGASISSASELSRVPMLVVTYGLAGNINGDLTKEPLGFDKKNKPVYLNEIWPSPKRSPKP